MADLPFIDFVPEPVAAALAFGEYHGYLDPRGQAADNLILLVYDLGGGTFDVSLIELMPGQIRTLGTDGDASLGGQDWDRRLADYLAQKFESRFRLDPRDDPQMCARLEELAREARESLATRQSVLIPLEMMGRKREISLTREQLELLTEDLLERTLHTTSALLQQCGLSWDRVDRLLLAGGATRMPAVVRAMNQLSGLAPDQTINPDEAVARGAAIHAAYRLGQTSGHQPDLRVKVVDIAVHSLGMEGVDPLTGRKEHKIVIPRNTPLPARKLQPFTIRSANQPSLVVRILEGESTDPNACTCIGHAVLDAIPAGLRRGQPVQVLFDLPRNGLLEVRLRVPGLAEDLRLQMQKTPGMADSQVAGWRAILQGPGRFATFEDMLRQVLGLQSVPSPAR
jgi:molecular chaperone DnaK